MRKQSKFAEPIEACFAGQDPVFQLFYSMGTWSKPPGELDAINIFSVAKATRRAFDRLGRAGIVAFCVIDAEWCAINRWKVGVYALACGFQDNSEMALRRVGFSVKAVLDLQAASIEVLKGASSFQQQPIGIARYGEYRRWRARILHGNRVFRYGLDRHFNLIEKQPVAKRARKPHPYPYWLQDCMYGSHDHGCRCAICTNSRG